MKEGLLTQDEINACYWGDNPTQVAYDAVFWYRFPLLKKAYARSEYREEQGYEKLHGQLLLAERLRVLHGTKVPF